VTLRSFLLPSRGQTASKPVDGSCKEATGLGVVATAGEEQGVGMVRVGGRRLAVDVVLVELDRIARTVAQRHHRAQRIGIR
jgi:hypothetical protein